MNTPRFLLLALFASGTAAAIDAPAPRVEAGALAWSPVDAARINVHRADGAYLETLPGSATRWVAPAPGGYFLVGTDDGDWRGWERSATVTVTGGDAGNPFDPVEPEPPASAPPTVDGPSAPRSLRHEVYSGRTAELFWEAPANGPVSGYEIFRNGTRVGTTTGRSFFDANLVPGVTWAYAVRAVVADRSSAPVLERFTTDDTPVDDSQRALALDPAPAPPPDLRVQAVGERSIELDWAGASAASVPVTGYEIYRNGRRIARTDATRYTVTDLLSGTDYRFAVRTVNASTAERDAALPIDVDTAAFPDTLGIARIAARTVGASAIDLSPGAGTLPADCLTASGAGLTFCFSAATRELLAFRGDGSTRWRFVLPGDPSSNDIRHLAWTSGTLVLVARTGADVASPGWEMSTFSSGGAFRATFPLAVGGGASIDANRADALSVRGGARGLIVLTPLLDDMEGDGISDEGRVTDGDDSIGVLRYDVSTGRLAAIRRLPGDSASFRDGANDGDAVPGTVRVSAGGFPYTLDEALLADAGTDVAPSAGARDSVRRLVDGWLEADITAAIDLDSFLPLGAETRVLDVLLGASGEPVQRTLACPGGGRAIELSPPGRAFVVWHYRFEQCVTGDRLLTGETRRTSIFGGGRLGGDTTTETSYGSLGIRYANGDSVSLLGSEEVVSRFGFGDACGGDTGRSLDALLNNVLLRFGGLETGLRNVRVDDATVGSRVRYREETGTFQCADLSTRTAIASADVRSDALRTPGTVRRDLRIERDARPGNAPASMATQVLALEGGAFQRDALRSLREGTVETTLGGGAVPEVSFVDAWRF